ncbi:MAG: hypothetical protein QOG72_319 [Sphingomonadales bacterium]|jgi:hypothetical protein|nr:hypothetical protein [Sphingomonadales bacterium]
MAWSTPDIASITDVLHDGLDTAIQAAIGGAFPIAISRSSPETSRKTPCQLSFYLMHVGRDAYWRNSPVAGPAAQLNRAQPLSLNLYYLLSAWADARYEQEQRAMTVALQHFHSNPIYRHLSAGAVDEEFTISVEADSIEEMSRLWQAFTVPMRLSCVVKVGVVFVAPAEAAPPLAKPPVTANLAVGPLPNPGDPVALYGAMNLAFAPFPADPDRERVSGGELVAVASGVGANSNIVVRGAGLDRPDASQAFLSTPDGLTEWELAAAWRQPTGDPGLLELILPNSYLAALPAAGSVLAQVPPPGVYRLAVGQNLPGDKPRSNRIPLVIAARVDGLTGPAAGPFTVTGGGFAAGSTVVSLGGNDVTATATIAPASIDFPLPPGLPPGIHAVEIAVNGVPSPPGPVVTL